MLIRTPEQDIERVLFTEKAIAARVEQLGAELTEQLGDKRPVLVCVLKGASFFYTSSPFPATVRTPNRPASCASSRTLTTTSPAVTS